VLPDISEIPSPEGTRSVAKQQTLKVELGTKLRHSHLLDGRAGDGERAGAYLNDVEGLFLEETLSFTGLNLIEIPFVGLHFCPQRRSETYFYQR